MSNNGDEKYDKKSKQNRSDIMVVIVILVTCILGLGYHLSKDSVVAAATTATSPIQTTSTKGIKASTITVAELESTVQALDVKVRAIKAKVDIFETDPGAQEAAKELQQATRSLLAARYGPNEPYHVKVLLEFQNTIPDFAERGAHGEFLIEMAPSALIPHSVYTFMEVARNWQSGAFHRIAGHVLQVMVRTKTKIPHLAFQEYSPQYPHKKMTCGYAGRPSGPEFYVSTKDNTKNHGPGSQQAHNPHEADANFGRVIEGFEESVMRISKVPGQGFLNDPSLHVIIKDMIIMVPNESGEYHVWSKE